MPSICIELFVLVMSKLDPESIFLTGMSDHTLNKMKIDMDIPSKYDSLLLDDLSAYHFTSIGLALITYSFITINYLDQIPNWQYRSFRPFINHAMQFIQILFVICDMLIRTLPLILILTTNTRWFYIIFGFEFLWAIEVLIWYRIYEYFPEFPMKKIYPNTYYYLQTYKEGDEISLPSESNFSPQIPMQSNPEHMVMDDNDENLSRYSVSSNASV